MIKRVHLVVLMTIASAVIATAQKATFKTYYNKENKVGFKYPAAKWKVAKEESQYWGGVEEPGFTSLVDLMRDDAALPGSVFQAEVSLKTAAIDEATCMAMKIGNLTDPNIKPVAKKIGARTFSYLTDSEGATGHASITQFYRTFNDGRCYELGFMTWGANNGAKRDRSDKAMDQQFSALLRSLYFK
jgi:hypothetical protein